MPIIHTTADLLMLYSRGLQQEVCDSTAVVFVKQIWCVNFNKTKMKLIK